MGKVGKVIGEWFSVLLIVAVLYLLVRPGSRSVDFVREFGAAMTALIATATDV